MNIREAILKAADHIERNPRDFNWRSVVVPKSRGFPGCAVGWIGHFLGHEHSATGFRNAAIQVFNNDERQFYSDMWKISDSWTGDAAECARALRIYADAHHPAAPLKLPDWNAMAAKQTVGTHEVSEELRA